MTGWMPPTPDVAIGLLVINMIAWGTWANTMKATNAWRYESYCISYALGTLVTALLDRALYACPICQV